MRRKGHFASCTAASPRECSCELRRYKIGLFITLGVCIFQILGSVLSGSLALLTDSAHVFSDTVGYGISIFVAHKAKDHAEEDAFRLRYMRASGGLLILVLLFSLSESVYRLRAETVVVDGPLLTAFAVVGGLGNLLQIKVMEGGEYNHTSRVQMLHILTDLLGSVLVIITGIIVWYSGLVRADSVLSAILSLVLIWLTARMMLTPEDAHHH
ncbi:MAG: cation diffusion facilitator family transporter [Patescibacteria group bacterium]